MEWVPQNLSQIPVYMGNRHLLEFQHSFTGEKGTSKKKLHSTMESGPKHRCGLVMISVLLIKIETLSVTSTVIKTQTLERNSETSF